MGQGARCKGGGGSKGAFLGWSLLFIIGLNFGLVFWNVFSRPLFLVFFRWFHLYVPVDYDYFLLVKCCCILALLSFI